MEQQHEDEEDEYEEDEVVGASLMPGQGSERTVRASALKKASSADKCSTGARFCRCYQGKPGGGDAPEAGCLACALAPFEPMEL